MLRPRERKRPPFAGAVAASAFLHAAVVWRLTFASAAPTTRGEDGREGGGGATFEVEIAGDASPDRPPLPGDVDSADVRADAPAEPTASPSALSPAVSPSAVVPPTQRPLPRDPRPATPTPVEAAPAAAASATTSESAPSVDGSGTGATFTDEGRTSGPDDARVRSVLENSIGGPLGGSSAGTIALLADAARCPDPVEGTWTAYRYSPEFRDWARFTVRIDRRGDELSGTIATRMWRGLPSDRRPPPCSPDGWDYTVEMTATGHVSGERFDFGARTHHVARVDCPSSLFGYNPDHFRGTFDATADRLDTVNNDGGRDVDAPYTFRRTSCTPR